MLDVVIFTSWRFRSTSVQLALASGTNKLAACALLFVVNMTGILANFLTECCKKKNLLICQDVFNF